METLGGYLLQMACWLAGFWLVYVLVLRKETYFALNRWFLLTGLMASLVMPFFPVRYNVVKAAVDLSALTLDETISSGIPTVKSAIDYWFIIYLVGVLFFLSRVLWQSAKLNRMRRGCECIMLGETPVFKLEKDTAPFSFFNSIYISKNLCGETELSTVVTHEKVHIDERHWADMLLLEVARTLQWFNPLLILYRKAMMQNHEYLADNGALQKGVSARTYKAVLANQMLGMPVLQVANGFTLSNQTKRIFMMNKDKTKPIRRLKLLWALPVIAVLLTAFAKPNYISGENIDTSVAQGEKTITVKGKVTDLDGESLPGTSIIIRNTTNGTVSDLKGKFVLEGVKSDDEIVFSFVGFETKVLKAASSLDVKMERSVILIETREEEMAPPPPPPPPAPSLMIKEMKGNGKPLIIVDGQVKDINVDQLDAESIATISVMKDAMAIQKYGDVAKDGVIEITTKKAASEQNSDEEVFVVVEDMPEYPGGVAALSEYIARETATSKEKGTVYVNFTVGTDGSISNVKVAKSDSEKLNSKAAKIIKGMPKWKPGMQRGKNVAVSYTIPVRFE